MQVEQDGVVYVTKNGVAIVEGLSDVSKKDIIIQKEINGCPVEIISESAFFGLDIHSIVLPHSLKRIESRAFALCEHLEIVLRDSIKKQFVCEMLTIEPSAFAQCVRLKKFNMSKHLSLNDHSFSRCFSLKSIDAIAKAVGEVFVCCDNLSCVTFTNNCDLTQFIDLESGIKTYNLLGDAKVEKDFLDIIRNRNIKIECYNNSNLCELAYDGVSVYAMDELF